MTDTKELTKVAAAPLAKPSQDFDMGAMFRLAIEKGPDGVEALEKLVALKERMEIRAADKALKDALSKFQEDCPMIRKDHRGGKATNEGGFGYDYAPLDTITTTIQPLLTKHGLSVSGDSDVVDNFVTAHCIVSHVDGGSMSRKFSVPLDTGGTMSAVQKFGSSLTYARRYALILALGLTTCDPDNDGADGVSDPTSITEDAVRDLNDMLIQAGYDTEQKKKRFLKWLNIDALSDLTVDRLESAFTALQKKIEDAKK